MNFGEAIAVLKSGGRVAREGWNGKGMWLVLTPGGTALASAVPRDYAALANIAGESPRPTHIVINSHIDMRAADGSLVIGWLASQTDMLAEDWKIVV